MNKKCRHKWVTQSKSKITTEPDGWRFWHESQTCEVCGAKRVDRLYVPPDSPFTVKANA